MVNVKLNNKIGKYEIIENNKIVAQLSLGQMDGISEFYNRVCMENDRKKKYDVEKCAKIA